MSSSTLEKLGIEYKEISQQEIQDAILAQKQSRLEQQIVGECQNFTWQTLLNRPDLIVIKHLDKISEQKKKRNKDMALMFISLSNPLRKAIRKTIQNQYYRYFILLITICSLIPHCIDQERLGNGLEIVCNIIFGFDIVFQIVAFGLILTQQSYLRNIWNVANVIAFIFTWFIFLQDNKTTTIIKTIRLLRVFRFIQEIDVLKLQFTAYVSSFLQLKKVLIPIFLVMICFAILGLHLFQGLTEKRCRLTPMPIDGKWEADNEILKLCGIWDCPENTYCGSPDDYNLPKIEGENDYEAFVWDFGRFDDFFHSFLVVLTFLNVTGWSGTTFMFWKAMTTYVTATYFLVLIVLLAFILSNLLLALFYDTFMEKSSIKNSQGKKQKKENQENEEDNEKKKNQQQLMINLTKMSKQKNNQLYNNQTFNPQFAEEQLLGSIKIINRSQKLFEALSNSKNFQILNNLFIILNALALIIDYNNISNGLLKQMQIIDFVCIIYSIFEMFILVFGKGIQRYFSKHINKFDFIIIISQWILLFILGVIDEPIIINNNIYVVFFKTLKILRLYRFVYYAKIFYTISILTRALINTLLGLKKILILWACLVIIIALVGKSLLEGQLDESPLEKTIHFDDIGSAIMASINIFYNEEWHISMYKYARKTYVSFVYFIASVLLGQIFFIRLLMAVFLNEFVQQLSKVEYNVKPLDYIKIIQSIAELCQSNQKQKNAMVLSQQNKTIQLQEELKSNKKLKTNSMSNQNIGDEEVQNWMQMDIQQQQDKISVNNIANIEKENNDDQQKQEGIQENLIKIKIGLIIDSLPFKIFSLFVVLLSTIRISLVTPFVDPNSQEYMTLFTISIITTIFFALQVIFNVLAYGLIEGENSFLQKSIYNLLNFTVTIIDIVALFAPSHIVFNFFASLRILEFIRIGSELSESINYISQALVKAFQTMIQLCFFCFIILIIYGTFATKLLKGSLYYCTNMDNVVNDKWECMDIGGSWINLRLGYDNIFDSALTLFITATTEAWLGLLINTWSARGQNLEPINNHNRWWAVYFQVFFFIGNICMLNMFISLVVDTYQQTKIKAQGMSELNDNQREWLSIKSSINRLKPRIMFEYPKNKLKLIIYYIAEHKLSKYIWHTVIAINTINLALFYTRQDSLFREAILLINLICILIFSGEIIARSIAIFPHYKQKDQFVFIDLIGIIINLINQFYVQQQNNLYFTRSFGALAIVFQLLRNYYIIKRFPELEKLFTTIFSVFPSALAMIFVMFLFLFIFTCLGMDLFGYLRPQTYLDGFDLHFKKFSTAMFSLIRVASSEQWWALLYDAVHVKTPDFACLNISTYDDWQREGYNGCGTYWAYVYFISFHLIFSLVILNLFIASILGAYDEHAKQEKSAISKYQLHDVLKYWAQYDPKGTGFLNYKQFWKLSSEIAICFGVRVEDLLDPANKKNFLTALNISLYENGEGIMGYLFHDVIVSLTRISVELKYGVQDLESTSYKGKDYVHSYYKDFKVTLYNSGQMSTIIYLQGKVRTLLNKKRGIKFLNIDKLKEELQNEAVNYDKQ